MAKQRKTPKIMVYMLLEIPEPSEAVLREMVRREQGLKEPKQVA
jgi:hypothetical protein